MVKKIFTLGLIALLLAATTPAMADEVFVTANGHKYHTAECRLVKNKKSSSIIKEEAAKAGYEPCKVCFKPKATEKSSEQQ